MSYYGNVEMQTSINNKILKHATQLITPTAFRKVTRVKTAAGVIPGKEYAKGYAYNQLNMKYTCSEKEAEYCIYYGPGQIIYFKTRTDYEKWLELNAFRVVNKYNLSSLKKYSK